MSSKSISEFSDLSHYQQTTFNVTLSQQNFFLGDYYLVVRNESALQYGMMTGAV